MSRNNLFQRLKYHLGLGVGGIFFCLMAWWILAETNTSPTPSMPIKLEFQIKIKKNDFIQVFYGQKGQEFEHRRHIIHYIEGSDNFQIIEIKLPDSLTSLSYLRVDISQETPQNSIEIKKCLIRNPTGEVLSLKGHELIPYFTPNPYIQQAEKSGVYKLQVLTKAQWPYDPYFLANHHLIDFINDYSKGFWKGKIIRLTLLLLITLGILVYPSIALVQRLRCYYIFIICFLLFLGLPSAINHLLNYTLGEIKFELSGIFKKDDGFQMFYFGQNTPFNHKNSVWFGVKGNPQAQTLSYKLHDTLQFSKIRIDVGQNIEQLPMIIQGFSIQSGVEKVMINGKDFLHYFEPNDCITIKNDTTFKTHEVPTAKYPYDPYFLSNERFSELFAQIKTKNHTLLSQALAGLCALSLFIYLFYYSQFLNGWAPSTYKLIFFSFLLCLFVPSILWGSLQEPSVEKRKKKPLPSFNLYAFKHFASAFTEYYDDNFGLRDWFVKTLSTIKLKGFNVVNNQNVMVGNHQFMFLNEPTAKANYTRQNLFTTQELTEIMQDWEAKNTLLAEREIKYYKVFYPNKNTIYNEYVPWRWQMQQRDTISQLTQVTQHMAKENASVQVVDIRPTLLMAKDTHLIPLYYYYDTHWNNLGAFYGYTALMEAVSKDYPSLRPHPLTDFEMIVDHRKGGDLLNLLGIGDEENFEDVDISLTYRGQVPWMYTMRQIEHKYFMVFENSRLDDGFVALVFRDSFSTALIPFLAPHFKKVIFIWTSYSQKQVDTFQPDIVIEGLVERNLK